MPIDLDSKEGRESFINNNLSDLLTAINETYGPIILDELLKRIELTINQFNDQINEAFNTLKKRDSKRKESSPEINPEDDNISNHEDKKKTEWEKKLEKIESIK